MIIVFEGVDGSGKTTQAEMLGLHFRSACIPFLYTREPGGMHFTEKIRELLLSFPDQLDAKTQLLLILAARRHHYNNLIAPAIKEGKIVICDRFILSTIVYQGYGFELDIEFINSMHKSFDCYIQADITFVLDAQSSECVKSGDDRFEKMDLDFFKKLSGAYQKLATQCDNAVLIKRNKRSKEDIHKEILSIVNSKREASS